MRARSWRTWTIIGVTLVTVALGVVGLVLNMQVPPEPGQWRISQFIYLTDTFWFTAVGAFITLRVPGNVIGPAGLGTGISLAVVSWAQGVLNGMTAGRPEIGIGWAAWLENWMWLGSFAGLFVLVLHFPDGRLPGRVWRWLEWAVGAVLGVLALATMSLPTSFDYPGVPTAIRVPLPAAFIDALGNLTVPLIGFFLAVVAVVIAQIVRWRRSHGARRAQLKWLLAASGLFAVVEILNIVLDAVGADGEHGAADLVTQIIVPLIPLAIAVAVTRQGLYEIDRLVSRTVSYALVVALLAAAYAVVVTAVSALVPASLGQLPVAAATLAASALFLPVRRRVVRAVDHRFNRTRYDADRVLAAFADSVRGGRSDAADDLLTATRHALAPTHATVWLVPQDAT